MIERFFLYFSIQGRCSRKFYWLLGVLPFSAFGFILGDWDGPIINPSPATFFINTLVVFGVLSMWPMLAMQIKTVA